MFLPALTLVHVLISLIGIATGLIVAYGMLKADRMDRWTSVFLITTFLTSATGYLFPVEKLLPSHVVGAISLVALAIALVGRYRSHLRGAWRWIYVVTAIMALYFNVFILVVQAFLKVPALHTMAPTGSEPPFAVAQGIVLLAFVALGPLAVRRFHPAAVADPAPA